MTTTHRHTTLRLLRLMAVAALTALTLYACSDEPDEPNTPTPTPPPTAESKTLLMYLPWSTNLSSYFLTNIADMEEAIADYGLHNTRVLVFMCNTSTSAALFEINMQGGACVRDTLKLYDNPAYTTAEGIADMLLDVQTYAPASSYAMTIGCHGLAWVPADRTRSRSASDFVPHWAMPGGSLTRFFGGLSEQYQTDICTLAEAIDMASMHMDFILFDDCFMSSVEVAYDLRHVADYLIACPTEIMSYGMPYHMIGNQLIGQTDYEAVCQSFVDFYTTNTSPYGTIAVTDCSQLDSLARVVAKINASHTFDTSLRDGLQVMEGMTTTLFYDFGDYMSALCTDADMLSEFNAQLQRAVPYKGHTEKFYTDYSKQAIDIRAYSGLNTSAPSTHSYALAYWNDTNWAKDTQAAQ